MVEMRHNEIHKASVIMYYPMAMLRRLGQRYCVWLVVHGGDLII